MGIEEHGILPVSKEALTNDFIALTSDTGPIISVVPLSANAWQPPSHRVNPSIVKLHQIKCVLAGNS